MRKLLIFSVIFTTVVAYAQYNDKDIRAYIEQYGDLAAREMGIYKIPVSITLAQAILESACGYSRLAKDGNNHFGIKCHKDWEGDTLQKDDDAIAECFRKYKKVEESFNDHSIFLATRDRYKPLFQLDILDYKAWATGLKSAGYATSPNYAKNLTELIERYNLAGLDTAVVTATLWTQPDKTNNKLVDEQTKPTSIDTLSAVASGTFAKPNRREIAPAKMVETRQLNRSAITPQIKSAFFTNDKSAYSIVNYPFTERIVYANNKTLFVIALPEDTYAKIAEEVQDTEAKLRKYNDAEDQAQPNPGEVVYIEYKNKYHDSKTYKIGEGETLRYISQKFAVRIQYLLKYNNNNTQWHTGDTIILKEETRK